MSDGLEEIDKEFHIEMEAKRNHHIGWASGLIQMAPKPWSPAGTEPTVTKYPYLLTRWCECHQVTVTRYPDGSGKVEVESATADLVNWCSPGWILMRPGGKIIESNGGFFEAVR